MKILITGGAGLIGSNVVKRFVKLGYEVHVADNLWRGKVKNLYANGYPVGYADHVDAEEKEMVRMIPALAISMGAKVIEKHITDDRTRKGRDHYSALNPDEFKSFVRLLRSLPDIIGVEQEWRLSEAEIKYRKFTKRQVVASHKIAAGTKLGLIDIAFKRTNKDGLTAEEISEYVGKKIKRSKKADKALNREDFIE